MPADNKDKVTILTLQKHKKNKQKTVLVTAYDYPQAFLAEEAGVDCVLVGDSAGMTVHGYETTIPVTMDQMVIHCEAVNRGVTNAFKIGDMPYMSYATNEDAVKNAGRFVVAGMDCVKVEGADTERIQAISRAGIMVMSHIGLTPQTRAKLGGYRVQGKTKAQFDKLLDQAQRLQDAGCLFLLLEAVPAEPAGLIAEKLDIPVYGIGAGNQVDGQLVIMHDLIGLFFKFKSKFVKRYCEAGILIRDSLAEYAKEVRNLQFPTEDNFYHMKEEELEKLLGDAKWKYEQDQSYSGQDIINE